MENPEEFYMTQELIDELNNFKESYEYFFHSKGSEIAYNILSGLKLSKKDWDAVLKKGSTSRTRTIIFKDHIWELDVYPMIERDLSVYTSPGYYRLIPAVSENASIEIGEIKDSDINLFQIAMLIIENDVEFSVVHHMDDCLDWIANNFDKRTFPADPQIAIDAWYDQL